MTVRETLFTLNAHFFGIEGDKLLDTEDVYLEPIRIACKRADNQIRHFFASLENLHGGGGVLGAHYLLAMFSSAAVIRGETEWLANLISTRNNAFYKTQGVLLALGAKEYSAETMMMVDSVNDLIKVHLFMLSELLTEKMPPKDAHYFRFGAIAALELLRRTEEMNCDWRGEMMYILN